MREYPFQREIPEEFKKKAIIRVEEPTIYVWQYKEAKKILQWASDKNYIIISIYVYKNISGSTKPTATSFDSRDPGKTRQDIKFVGVTWNYRGDRTRNKSENKVDNSIKASQFVENIHREMDADLWYEILFQSDESWDEIEIEFFDKAIVHGGEKTYQVDDAIAIVEKCRELHKRITGIEAFKITYNSIQPIDYMSYSGVGYEKINTELYYAKHHIRKNSDEGHWQEAEQWLKNRASEGWTFEIGYKWNG
jgi:hypothetical protein